MTPDPPGLAQPTRSGRGRRARCLLAVVGGIGVLVTAGCGGAGGPGGSVSATVTIAAVPGIDTAPLYLAQKDGYFATAGLRSVVIKAYPSASAELRALQGGQVDIAASDYGDIFYAQSQSPDLRLLADGYDAAQGVLEILTMPGSPITSPVDLANKVVGVPGDQVLPGLVGSGHPISLDSAAASQVLSNYLGNNVESVTWQPMSQQQEITALERHQLPAVLVTEPYIYEAESQVGAVAVMDACSGSTAGLPLTGYVAMNTWVKDNSAAAADFQSALVRAQPEASMPGQVQQVLPKDTGMTVEDAVLSAIGTYPTATSAVALERVVRLMADSDMIRSEQAPKVPPMIVKLSG